MPSTSTSTLARPLTLIVATTAKNGIGLHGALPWPSLKQEMAYFARVTKRPPPPPSSSFSSSPPSQPYVNAVIMGRKTWTSIPPKFRPLKSRINVVITRHQGPPEAVIGSLPASAAPVIVAGSIRAALAELETRWGAGATAATGTGTEREKGENEAKLGRVFIIGGAEIYRSAIDTGLVNRMLVTRVTRPEFECDAFFPVDLAATSTATTEVGAGTGAGEWERSTTEALEAWTGEGKGALEGARREKHKAEEGKGEGEVEYEFCMFTRRAETRRKGIP